MTSPAPTPQDLAPHYVGPLFCTACETLLPPTKALVGRVFEWACRHCGRVGGLIPPDSPRARDRPDHLAMLRRAEVMAWKLAADKYAAAMERRRHGRRMMWAAIASVVATFVLIAAGCAWLGSAAADKATTARTAERAATTTAPATAAREAACHTIRSEIREADPNGQGFPSITCDGGFLRLDVSEGWYALPCFKRRDTVSGIVGRWRQLGGTGVRVRYNGRQVAASTWTGAIEIDGCP